MSTIVLIFNSIQFNSKCVYCHKLGWQTVLERREFLTGILMFKCIFNLAPFYLSDNITYVSQIHDHQTRNCANDNLYVPQPRTEYIKRSFLYNGSKIWNKLPLDVRRSQNIMSI